MEIISIVLLLAFYRWRILTEKPTADGGQKLPHPIKTPMPSVALRSGIIFLAATVLAGSVTTLHAGSAPKEFKLTLVTSQPKPQFDNRFLPLLSELFETRSGGRIKVQFLGGPEVVPQFQALEYLKRGTMDMGHLVSSYLSRAVPEFDVIYLGGTPATLRKSGALDLLNEVLVKQHGVRNLGSLQGSSFVFISNKKIEKASFAGLKMRVIPGVPSKVAEVLGATNVTTPAPEFYTALERGIVDGGSWPIVPIATWKLHEVAKYIILPPYIQGPSYVFLIRETVWKSLPSDLQKVMSNTIAELEEEFFLSTIGHELETVANFEKSGSMQPIVLPPEEAVKYKTVAEKAGWEQLIKQSPNWGPRFESLLRKK